MRVIRKDVRTIPAGQQITVDYSIIGANSALIELNCPLADNPVVITDINPGLTIFHQIARMWPDFAAQAQLSRICVPLIQGLLNINNANTVQAVTATILWFDEAVPRALGRYTEQHFDVVIAAGGNLVPSQIQNNDFPTRLAIFKGDRAFHVDLFLYYNSFPGDPYGPLTTATVVAAGGGVTALSFTATAEFYTYRIVNDDGANPINLSYFVTATIDQIQ